MAGGAADKLGKVVDHAAADGKDAIRLGIPVHDHLSKFLLGRRNGTCRLIDKGARRDVGLSEDPDDLVPCRRLGVQVHDQEGMMAVHLLQKPGDFLQGPLLDHQSFHRVIDMALPTTANLSSVKFHIASHFSQPLILTHSHPSS